MPQLFQEVLEHIWERGHDNARDLKVQCNCILLQYNLLLQFQLVLRTNTPTGIEQLFPFPLQISFLVHFSILLESEMKGTRLSITQYFCSALCPTNSCNLTFIIKKTSSIKLQFTVSLRNRSFLPRNTFLCYVLLRLFVLLQYLHKQSSTICSAS